MLFDYPCLFISSGNKFAPISMTNQNCTRRTKKESSLFFCDLNFDQNKNKKKVPSLSRRSFLSLVMSLLFSLMLLGKARIKEEEDKALLSFGKEGGGWSVSPRSSVSLCEKADPPPTTHQSFHPRRRRHPTKKKTKGCSVLFRSFSEQTEHKRTVDDDPRENLIISSLKNARRFLPALTVVSLSRSIHQRRSLKNTLGSLRTEEEEGE